MALVPLLAKDGHCPVGFEPFMICTFTGIRLYIRHKENGDVDVAEVQPIDAILDQNQRDQYNAKGSFTQKGKWGALAGRVPVSQLNQWMEDGQGNQIVDDDERSSILRKKLNDSDNRKFRVAEFNM